MEGSARTEELFDRDFGLSFRTVQASHFESFGFVRSFRIDPLLEFALPVADEAAGTDDDDASNLNRLQQGVQQSYCLKSFAETHSVCENGSEPFFDAFRIVSASRHAIEEKLDTVALVRTQELANQGRHFGAGAQLESLVTQNCGRSTFFPRRGLEFLPFLRSEHYHSFIIIIFFFFWNRRLFRDNRFFCQFFLVSIRSDELDASDLFVTTLEQRTLGFRRQRRSFFFFFFFFVLKNDGTFSVLDADGYLKGPSSCCDDWTRRVVFSFGGGHRTRVKHIQFFRHHLLLLNSIQGLCLPKKKASKNVPCLELKSLKIYYMQVPFDLLRLESGTQGQALVKLPPGERRSLLDLPSYTRSTLQKLPYDEQKIFLRFPTDVCGEAFLVQQHQAQSPGDGEDDFFTELLAITADIWSKKVAKKWYEFIGFSPPSQCNLILTFGAVLDVDEMRNTVHWKLTFFQRTARLQEKSDDEEKINDDNIIQLRQTGRRMEAIKYRITDFGSEMSVGMDGADLENFPFYPFDQHCLRLDIWPQINSALDFKLDDDRVCWACEPTFQISDTNTWEVTASRVGYLDRFYSKVTLYVEIRRRVSWKLTIFLVLGFVLVVCALNVLRVQPNPFIDRYRFTFSGLFFLGCVAYFLSHYSFGPRSARGNTWLCCYSVLPMLWQLLTFIGLFVDAKHGSRRQVQSGLGTFTLGGAFFWPLLLIWAFIHVAIAFIFVFYKRCPSMVWFVSPSPLCSQNR